jgi:hypothetical protein
MKTVLVVVAFSSGCFASAKPAPRAPATPAPESGAPCPIIICGDNGTRLTGLTNGDQSSAIHAITLPSGEVIRLR